MIRATQLSKICCTHGKLCCSDQQIFPGQLAEILGHQEFGTESRIPKNIPNKKHSYSLRFVTFLILNSRDLFLQSWGSFYTHPISTAILSSWKSVRKLEGYCRTPVPKKEHQMRDLTHAAESLEMRHAAFLSAK